MAAQTAVTAQHATLSGTTADSIVFSGVGNNTIRVTNRDSSIALYFNVNSSTVPVSAADDVYYVAPGASVAVTQRGNVSLARVVGNGNAYSVEIFPKDSVTGGGGGGGGGAVTNAGTFATQATATTTGGLTCVLLTGADGAGGVLVATAQAVKATAGALYGYYIYNPNSAATWVHFYNVTSANATVGTTNPLVSITIPATSAANLSFPIGVTFSTAISAAATTTAGGNTAPSTGLDVTVFIA